jgi:hypothetical protein
LDCGNFTLRMAGPFFDVRPNMLTRYLFLTQRQSTATKKKIKKHTTIWWSYSTEDTLMFCAYTPIWNFSSTKTWGPFN